ncbi:MAG: 50S ribosomal protein L22 [Acidobacteria bacterium]|jgi:large subunit ribosomal protein L22|nr:50S ribosomal protein L22 [Acidobacteriota bacterium]|tara:strand:+ start:947 stop:1486 length:540 start_codon:yes stop_codon:yes gene_type:complete
MIEAHATARYVRTSAQKAKLVLDVIRGREVNAALATLQYARKAVARDIEKVLRSAIANAQQKDGFTGDVDRLIVSACYANEGPSMKRVRPAPMGRAFRIVKRTAHLTVRVSERQEAAAITDVAPASAGASEETEPAELTPSTKRAARKTPVKKRKRKKTGDAAGSRRASTTRRKTASKE